MFRGPVSGGWPVPAAAWQGDQVVEQFAGEPTDWVPLPDVAERLDLTISKVRQLVRECGLLAVRRDGVLRVPADLIETTAGGSRATATYCSAELEIAPGDVVRLLWEDATHGAWWCENAAHERGWVRADFLQFNEEP